MKRTSGDTSKDSIPKVQKVAVRGDRTMPWPWIVEMCKSDRMNVRIEGDTTLTRNSASMESEDGNDNSTTPYFPSGRTTRSSTSSDDDLAGSTSTYDPNRKSLEMEEENRLVQRVIKLERIGYTLTVAQFKQVAYKFAEEDCLTTIFKSKRQEASQAWTVDFIERHPEMPIKRYLKGGRHLSTRWNCSFNTYEKHLDQYEMHNNPRGIYSLFQYSVAHLSSNGRMTSTLIHEVTKLDESVAARIMVCCSAAGEYVPPCLVLKAASSTSDLPTQVPSGTYVVLSEAGRMNSHMFLVWLDHFNAHRAPGHVTLLLYGVAAYVNDEQVLQYAEAHGIHMLCMMTEILHSLHMCIYSSLTASFNKLYAKFDREHPEKRLTKKEFGTMFTEAWKGAASGTDVVSKYRESGIYPLKKILYPQEIRKANTKKHSRQTLRGKHLLRKSQQSVREASMLSQRTEVRSETSSTCELHPCNDNDTPLTHFSETFSPVSCSSSLAESHPFSTSRVLDNNDVSETDRDSSSSEETDSDKSESYDTSSVEDQWYENDTVEIVDAI